MGPEWEIGVGHSTTSSPPHLSMEHCYNRLLPLLRVVGTLSMRFVLMRLALICCIDGIHLQDPDCCCYYCCCCWTYSVCTCLLLDPMMVLHPSLVIGCQGCSHCCCSISLLLLLSCKRTICSHSLLCRFSTLSQAFLHAVTAVFWSWFAGSFNPG